MKLIGWILLACLVIAAAQAIAAALVLALIVGLVCCLYRAPKETLALAGLAVLMDLAVVQPLAFLGLAALATGAGLILARSTP